MSITRSVQSLVAAITVAAIAACGSTSPTDVTLAALAAEQERYDGRTVTTEGTVTAIRDAPADEPYYVLQDQSRNRVRLVPADVAQPHDGDLVQVTGTFRFIADRGRELQIEEITGSR